MLPDTHHKTYWLETYGCQMNKAESSALEIVLREAGYAASPQENTADLVILNTCSVRASAEERIHGRLGHFRHLKNSRRFILAIIGCMSERMKGSLRRQYPEIDILIGTFQKKRFLEALEEVCRQNAPQERYGQEEYEFAALHTINDFKAFIPIMHGCDNYCSYCIVPYVRGHEVSRAPHEILAELQTVRERGALEVTLLGQNVNSYRFRDNGVSLDFSDLLKLIAENTPPGNWIRFLTSHPKDCTRELIEFIASSPVCCRHIHLPVQHGSDRILSLMNRGYTRQDYLDLISLIKNTVSGVTITTDILIGFPSESQSDFDRTLDLMKEVEFDDAYTYYYNPRQGTKAFAMEDTVPREEKLDRLNRVIDVTRQMKRKRQSARTGRRAVVLVEAVSKKNAQELLSRTEHDEMVVFPGSRSLIGSFAEVMIQELQGTTFRAILLS